MIAANVPGPSTSTYVPVHVMSTNVPVPDINPSSPKRRRQSIQNLEMKEFQVGRKVKIQARPFGSKWAKTEFGNSYKTKIMLETILSMVDQPKNRKKMDSLVCNQFFSYRSQKHTIRFEKI